MSSKNKSHDGGQQRIRVISKPRYIIQTQISEKLQLLKPVAVAVSPADGKIAVADQDMCQIFIFDRKYKFIKVIGHPGDGECEFNGPKGIGISTEGGIIVADSGNNRIQVLSPAGEFITKFGQFGKGVGEFDDMVGIVVDSQNRIYVLDCGNNRIQIVDIHGHFVREFGSCGNKNGDVDHPQGVAVCPSTGNVMLADTNNKRVQVFYATGQHRLNVGWTGYGEGELLEPVSVAAGPDWTILVADPTQGRISVYKSDGNLIKEIGHCGNLDNGEQFEPRHLAVNRDTKEVIVVDSLNKRLLIFKI